MTEMMRAGVASENGLCLQEVARPSPGPEEILVKVAAAGMNRADGMAATGLYGGPNSLGQPIGFEWAGEIIGMGADVSGFEIGEIVMASGSGGYAEYAISDMKRTAKIGTLDPVAAASLPLVLLTAYNAVTMSGGLKEGGSILVQGASSAVGLMAMQIARHFGADTIIGTSMSPEKRARLKEFGATYAVDTSREGWAKDVLNATDGKGVDLVVDMVSGRTINETMKATAIKGRIVNVGRLGGAVAEFDFNLHAARRIDYVGVTFRTRTLGEIREIAHAAHATLLGPLQDGELGLPLDRTFALSEAGEALGYMEANTHFGKIALLP